MSRKETSSINPYHFSSSGSVGLSQATEGQCHTGSEKCSDKGYSDSGVFSGEIHSGEITHVEDHSSYRLANKLSDCEEGLGSNTAAGFRDKSEQSSFVDSGFCSGSNIVSKEALSADESSDFIDSVNQSGPMRSDSGIGDSVSHQFSELNLKENDSSNDLNNPRKNSNSSSKFIKSPTNVNRQKPQEHTQQRQLLEACFKQNEDGDTELHKAIMHRYIEIIHALVRMVPNPKYLNIWNCDRQTPLHLAVLTDQPNIVRMLVCAGASLDILDRFGNTPLHLAVQANSVACVQCIMNSVAVEEISRFHLQYPPYQYHPKTNAANIYNYEGQTCVHLAALNGNVEILRHLLWYGANINAQEWKGGQTSLHIAVENRDSRLCQFLLKEAKINAEETSYAGHTAYQTSYGWDDTITEMLHVHGVDPYVSSDSESDSDDDMLDLSANGFKTGVQMNGGGWINVGA